MSETPEQPEKKPTPIRQPATAKALEGTIFAKRKTPVDARATHVMVHATSATGKMMGAIRLESPGEQWEETWPLCEVTEPWVDANFGPGCYRFAFYAVDAAGRKARLGSTGNMEFSPMVSSPRPRQTTESHGPQTGVEPMLAMVRMLEETRRSERAEASQRYERASERDRLFMTAVLGSVRAPTGLSAEDVRAAVRQELETGADEPEGLAALATGGEQTSAMVNFLQSVWQEVRPHAPMILAKLTAEKAKLRRLQHTVGAPVK